MSTWTFTIKKDYDDIFAGDTYRDWQALYAIDTPTSHIFNHPDVIRAWVDTFGKTQRINLCWLAAATTDGNRSLFPLVLWRRNWKNAFMRVLMPAGGGDYDYHNPLFLRPTDISEYYTALLQFLKSSIAFDELRFDGIRDALVAETPEAQWRKGEMCPLLHLNTMQTSADLLPHLRTSLRGDLRRQMRRIEESVGPLQMVEIKTHDEAMKQYDLFMQSHRQRWPNAYKTPGFQDALLSDRLLADSVSFTVLMAGDKSLAWHLGFQDKKAYYYYMPAGNPEYLPFSPVKVHLLKLMERAIDRGMTIYDHLRGEENYKSGWSDDSQCVNTLYYTPTHLFSRLQHLLLQLRPH